jgi:N-acetylglutamate synthase-like GNAT family acetyltransferase
MEGQFGKNSLSHPFVNTVMVVLAKSELERFYALTSHTTHFFQGA